ncbi:helix-turn-helix domain-containing protein [Pseudarthrobacter sp. H2]|uniref:helix-turn-helix domain-containing protein n=1 Tax=Pseudarthrobacter sp. H2 TaxID=3418415 RepID=UPI003CEFB331
MALSPRPVQSVVSLHHAWDSARKREARAAKSLRQQRGHGARGRTGGQKPKLGPRQVKLARDMYEEKTPDGKRAHTVQHIADEFGVTRPTIYRHLTGSNDKH